jgi:hypothetical protein
MECDLLPSSFNALRFTPPIGNAPSWSLNPRGVHVADTSVMDYLHAIAVIAAFAEGRPPFSGAAPPEGFCIRLGNVPCQLMDRICTHRGLRVLAVERWQFADGWDFIYLVQPAAA